MTTNTNTTASLACIDIESIVRKVMQELGQGSEIETSKAKIPKTSEGEFAFTQRVITLEDLKSIPSSTKTIRVPSGAVLTPSVRDELRTLGIRVTKTESSNTRPSAEVRTKLPFRRVNLQHDETVDAALFDAVEKQVSSRGIRLCDQAGVTAILSDRPATLVYQSIAANTSAVAINRVDDIARFKNQLRPTVFVLDIHHLHTVALVDAVMQIAHRVEKIITPRPRITVAGGQS